MVLTWCSHVWCCGNIKMVTSTPVFTVSVAEYFDRCCAYYLRNYHSKNIELRAHFFRSRVFNYFIATFVHHVPVFCVNAPGLERREKKGGGNREE